MDNLEQRIEQANSILAPYAVSHDAGLGRVHEEEEDDTRYPFQRDRGRIINTEAFRRLKGKTQVFVGGGTDHYRTRLTHTLEVASISRDIARVLSLNEDLAECIALSHDLGHPPFGHAGESALDMWMKTHGQSFEHNQQSLRIVTELASHSSQSGGLNLRQEILEGLQKHRTPHDHPKDDEPSRHPSLEAQVVNIADEISYAAHDAEDGLNEKLFSLDEIRETSLANSASAAAEKRGTPLRGSIINLLAKDLYEATEGNIMSQRITTLDAVYQTEKSLVTFSDSVRQNLNDLHAFLQQKMYKHPAVKSKNEEGQKIIAALCARYFASPTEKILALQKRTGGTLEEAVKDYVSGMTDAYAFTQSA